MTSLIPLKFQQATFLFPKSIYLRIYPDLRLKIVCVVATTWALVDSMSREKLRHYEVANIFIGPVTKVACNSANGIEIQ